MSGGAGVGAEGGAAGAEEACPPADRLLDFTAGQLTDGAAAAIEAHIDRCGACRATLSSLARGAAPSASFGRYRLDTVLGSGGMGIVYRAWDPQLARAVAIKVVKRAEDDAAGRARLVREAQSLARLSHTNVCHVYDVGSEGDEVWVAMELVDGPNLRQWAADHPSHEELVPMLLGAAEGLAAAHAAEIIHRDVKPENVLVTREGRAVVTDFGLARVEVPIDPAASASAARIPQKLTATGAIAGTPGYLAPEQLTGGAIDARVDQFAWAVMAWELLAGLRPFPEAAEARLGAIEAGLKPPPRLPRHVAAALAQALSPSPQDRFASMRELIEAIRKPRRKRTPLRPAVVAAIAAAIAVGSTLLAWRLLKRPVSVQVDVQSRESAPDEVPDKAPDNPTPTPSPDKPSSR
jgi:serine/threonine protein kinase